uniref:NADH:ubiquinone reductase (H(+)-translocating) n=1 Tax=Cephalonomia gallicola TaxID=627714 RepID=E0WCE9_9HYME|nr:NADH dehydrogenase subunit 5 [Cephalonomia gallicola]
MIMYFLIYMWNLMFFSLMFFMFSIYLKMMNFILYFEWEIFYFDSMNFFMVFFFDWLTFLFISIVFFITFIVMLYSIDYMYNEKYIKGFYLIMFLFVLSMFFMLVSPNLMSILLGWDLLGLTSFCLVIYYSSINSLNSGIITFISNRVGDVLLLISSSFMLMYGSMNLFLWDEMNKILLFLILLVSLTKSAQLPFSVWLPKAMAAPTPVSSLVHSSTLVTAGVYLDFRYSIISQQWGKYLIFLSLFTMILSGFMAWLEYDFKKVIAYSTLSQLGLMMMILSINLKFFCMFHLMMHALFKSMLFMSAGMIIHNMYGLQDLRFMGSLVFKMPFVIMILNLSNLSLCGMPFLSGFYSKDLIFEIMFMKENNFFLLILLFLGMMLTFMYTLRLMKFLLVNKNFKSVFIIEKMKFMFLSLLILSILSILGGSMFFWLFYFDLEIIYLNFKFKLIIYVLFIYSMFLFNLKFSMNYFIKFILMMFNLEYMYMYMSFLFLKMSKILFKSYDLYMFGDYLMFILFQNLSYMMNFYKLKFLFLINYLIFLMKFFFFFFFLCM